MSVCEGRCVRLASAGGQERKKVSPTPGRRAAGGEEWGYDRRVEGVGATAEFLKEGRMRAFVCSCVQDRKRERECGCVGVFSDAHTSETGHASGGACLAPRGFGTTT
jgi:hypothetical protein